MKEIRYLGEAEQQIKQLQEWRGLGETFNYCGILLTVIGYYVVEYPLAKEQMKYIPVVLRDYTVEIRVPMLRTEYFSEVKGGFVAKDFTFDMLEVLKVHNLCMP